MHEWKRRQEKTMTELKRDGKIEERPMKTERKPKENRQKIGNERKLTELHRAPSVSQGALVAVLSMPREH
jgi:hypothetical protein